MKTCVITNEPQADGSVVRGFLCGTFPREDMCGECRVEIAEFLCDARSGSRTCNRRLCGDCTRKRGPDLDFCSRHQDQSDGYHTGPLL